MTDLKDKAIKISGKSYVLVSDRILAFNETYPEGSITTELLSTPDADMVVIKATVKVGERLFTGHSQAKWGDGYINKTSAMENCETSAVGRALAMMGIGVLDSVASADEMVKAGATTRTTPENGAGTNGLQNKCQCGQMFVERTVTVKRGTPEERQAQLLACPNATKENQAEHSKPVWL
jgi:hypothetical protein